MQSKSITILLFSALIITSSTRLYSQENETARINEFFEQRFSDYLDRHPELQSRLGIKKAYDKWDDISDEFAKKELVINRRLLQELRSFDYDKLDEQAKMSYRLFEFIQKHRIEEFRYRHYLYLVNQIFGLQSTVPAFLINMHRIAKVGDAEAYISRLSGLRHKFDQLIERLRFQEERGVILPKFIFPLVIENAKNVLAGHPFAKAKDAEEQSPLLDDFTNKVKELENVAASKKSQLIKSAEDALVSSVKPAYESLIKFLARQQSKATNDAGVWKFPKGEAFYQHQLKTFTSSDLSAEEIHQIGLHEVARIHGEMKRIMKEVDFKDDDLLAFFRFMREDQQFYLPNTEQGREQYLAKTREIFDAIRGRLDELFLTIPKAEMVVKRVEPFREKSAGKAFYNFGAPDGSRPGVYYVNLYDMNDMPTYSMEALAYHEGIPGHHMQISTFLELSGLPRFRKMDFILAFTAHTEGWGLYSELLPKEIGFYTDPYSDFGRLSYELWRACRLVVDTGIHAKRWTRQEAIDYYVANTANPKNDCVKMVDRHIVAPGQATAYKIGMMKILELREMAKQELADKFDIREYHDEVLKFGPLPLSLLEENVKSWIKMKGSQD